MQNPNKTPLDIPKSVRIEPGKGGLQKIVVASNLASAEIYLNGAHVTHYQPAGQQPVLFISEQSAWESGKPIRGGVPICFPWFGSKQGDPRAPGHGVARLRIWTIESITQDSAGVVTVTLSLKSDEQTRAMWPFDFAAKHIVSIGSSLEMKLTVQNASQEPFKFEEALHTYLTVGDIKQVSIDGLMDTKYIDKVDGGKTKQQTDPQIRFTGETDRPYLGTEATCIVTDPAMNRKLEVSKRGSKATVVWNPWIAKAKSMPDFGDDEWPNMVCVETANVAEYAVELQPGATHEMSAKVRIG